METNIPETAEFSIISAIKAGNEKAFEIFYRAEYCNLKYFLTRYMTDYSIIEDIVHDSFITIWENREKINLDQSLKSFLFTIARNRIINILRNRTFKLTDSLDKSEIAYKISVLSDDYMSSRIDALDMQNVIDRTYDLLPAKIKDSFVLSRKNGLSYKEISDQLGISVKTVEHNISAALKIFKKKLGRFILCIPFFMGLLR